MITKMKQILGAAAAMLMLAACGSPKTNLPLEGTQWKLTEMDGKADPDYARCVDLCSRASLKEMVAPTLLAIISPIVVGLVLGGSGVVGMLCGALVTGFILAIFMANSGGAWDNAKKYIESGHHGGKGSEQHKAAVVGDTVGDPFKDTSGPSINILIKLMTVVSLVFASIFSASGLL